MKNQDHDARANDTFAIPTQPSRVRIGCQRQSEKEPLEVDRKHQSQYFKEYSKCMTEALLRFDLILLRLTLYVLFFVVGFDSILCDDDGLPGEVPGVVVVVDNLRQRKRVARVENLKMKKQKSIMMISWACISLTLNIGH